MDLLHEQAVKTPSRQMGCVCFFRIDCTSVLQTSKHSYEFNNSLFVLLAAGYRAKSLAVSTQMQKKMSRTDIDITAVQAELHQFCVLV